MIYWMILWTAWGQEPPPSDAQVSMEYANHQMQQVQDMRCSVAALELFLEDKANHAEHCPELEWVQPAFEDYKAEPSSKLPPVCLPPVEPPVEPPPESSVLPVSDGS